MKKQTIKMTGVGFCNSYGTESKITFELGKVAPGYYRDMKKRSLVMVEFRMCEPIDSSPMVSISADIWNASQTDILMGGQCLDTIAEPEMLGQLSEDAQKIFLKLREIWNAHHLQAPTPRVKAMYNVLFAMSKMPDVDAKSILNVLEAKEI